MDKVFTAQQHVEWLEEQVRQKRPYWYGVYFKKCTEDLLQRKRKQYPGHYTDKRMATYRRHIAAGQIAGDCVNGAIKGAVWSELGKREPVYKSHDCPDRSADGMFEYCKSIGMPWGTIGTIPDKPDVAVRFSGHVGIYVGDGMVIEWRGFAYGVVKTKLKDRPWTHWYELPWTDYEGTAEPEKPNEAPVVTLLGNRLLKRGRTGADVKELQQLLVALGYLPEGEDDGDYGKKTEAAVTEFQRDNDLEADGDYGEKSHAAMMGILAEREAQLGDEEDDVPAVVQLVQVIGGSVYIRKGAGTKYDIITVAHRGDMLVHVSTAETGWHAVMVNGQVGWISGKYSKVVGGDTIE